MQDGARVVICLDGTTPKSPQFGINLPSTTISTLSTGGTGVASQQCGLATSSAVAASASTLLPSFNASAPTRNVKQREEAMKNNAHLSLQNLEKANNLNRQRFKDKLTITTPERERSKVAKKNKKEILGPLKAMSKSDEDEFVDIMASVVAA